MAAGQTLGMPPPASSPASLLSGGTAPTESLYGASDGGEHRSRNRTERHGLSPAAYILAAPHIIHLLEDAGAHLGREDQHIPL